MRKQIAKVLREAFESKVRERLPGFRPEKVRIGSRTETVFGRRCDANLFFFILLVLDPKRDWFTVESGWSNNGKFPADELPDIPTEKTCGRAAMLFRVPFLWAKKDEWWELAPEWSDEDWDEWLFNDKERPDEPTEVVLAKVPPVVDEVIDKIQKHLIPFFRRVSARHGVQTDNESK